jgi:hypothetical protein
MKHHLPQNLRSYGKKVKSQNDEDGIIEAIFANIRPRSRYFVEFGCGPNWQDIEYKNGIEANCVLLRDNYGWKGVFMDGGEHPAAYDIKREFITASNVNTLFRKYSVPESVDVVSIDVDYQDLWIFMAINYKPTLFIVEYNANFFNIEESVSVRFDIDGRWDFTKYYGASLGAFNKIARDKGYRLVCANGCNAFFVLEGMIANPEDFVDKDLHTPLDQHQPDHLQRRWVKI